jgi:tRNA pseudouridine32 synthase/23S rRNA pseudouridine746 synthase/23S rRNA pseudouridine1911/1915/1917 synthase
MPAPQPRPRTKSRNRRPGGLAILYEDRDLLVIDKPAGLLTMATDKERERTAYWLATDYVRRGFAGSRNRVFIVHRLDRDTSGVLVFAKTPEAKNALQDHWEEVEKTYVAVAHGLFAEPEGTISSYLAENQAQVVFSTPDPALGKISHTAYRVVRESGGLSLLEIRLLTGRKNQIRVHLADRGHPVLGDSKYGRSDDGCKRLALHARMLTLKHPSTGRRLTFEAPVPDHFPAHVNSAAHQADLDVSSSTRSGLRVQVQSRMQSIRRHPRR